MKSVLFSIACALAAGPVQTGADLPSYKDLRFPPLRAIQLPKPEIFELSNGMRVYLLEDHELPLVSGFALVRTGNLFDPPDQRGLAELTGRVLRSGGTKDMTGDRIDEQLENVAASVESGIGESSGSVSFSCLRENADTVLALFRDVIAAPEFRQAKIDLAKTQMRSGISRRNDDAGAIAAREFASHVYGAGTPYGWDIDYEHIDRIGRAGVIAFYQRYFFPANVMLGVYGDFRGAEMKDRLEKLFGGWRVKQAPVPAFPEVRQAPAPGVYFASKEDVTQTFFEIGHLGGVLRDPDFPALGVAADILGSGFSSRLVKKVRTELGYAYDVDAGWDASYDHPGLFRISGSTKSATTEETIDAIRTEVERIRAEEVTTQEIETAKSAVVNSFVFFFDRPSKTLRRMMMYDYFGYPRDFIFEYQKAIQSVTKADVLRAARQYFRPERFTIVAVGNAGAFGKPLAALGLPVKPIDLSIPEPARSVKR